MAYEFITKDSTNVWKRNKDLRRVPNHSRVLNYTFSAGSTKVRFEPQAAIIKRF